MYFNFINNQNTLEEFITYTHKIYNVVRSHCWAVQDKQYMLNVNDKYTTITKIITIIIFG